MKKYILLLFLCLFPVVAKSCQCYAKYCPKLIHKRECAQKNFDYSMRKKKKGESHMELDNCDRVQ